MRPSRPLMPEAPPLSPLPARPAYMPALWKWTLAMLLLAYVALSAAHLCITPVAPDATVNYINAPDEAAHLLYARAIAEGGRLPRRGDPEYPTYEWHQPPLYYALASPLYRLGPHAVRSLSLVLGLIGLLAIFYAARRLFPTDPPLAVMATGLAATLPMRHAVCATVDNDALVELLFTASFALCIEGLRSGFPLRRAALLGAVLGAALLTKSTGLLLIPFLLTAFVLFWRCGEHPRSVVAGAVLTFLLALTLAGGWYARNLRLYGEVTAARTFTQEFAGTKRAEEFLSGRGFTADWWTGRPEATGPMSRAAYLGVVSNWTFRTFFAAYTPPGGPASLGIPYFMRPQFYLIYALIGTLAAAGLVRAHLRRRRDFTGPQLQGIALAFVLAFLVLAAFSGFVWVYFQTQGRYLYPATFPLASLTALGFRCVLPSRYRDLATLVALGLTCVLAAAFIVEAIVPAYS